MSPAGDVSQNRQRLAKLLQLHGYCACREALVLLVDHFTNSTKYESVEDFIYKLNRVITFDTNSGCSIIDPDLADLVIKKLCNEQKRSEIKTTIKDDDNDSRQEGNGNDNKSDNDSDSDSDDDDDTETGPANLVIKVKNVECQLDTDSGTNRSTTGSGVRSNAVSDSGRTNEFNIHYNFLYKRLNSLPIFKEHFQLMRLDALTASTQPSIRCICFGLLVKDISKIDGYMLIDNTGRVPVRLTHDTIFKNRLAYTNCIVLVEGVYVNPDDVLFVANVGLPPVLLDPIPEKRLACRDEKMIVILRELFMDDEDVCRNVDMLFTGYNSMEEPPILFILIGDFTRHLYAPTEYRSHSKKLIRIIRMCDNLKSCHFVFVPGSRDTAQLSTNGSSRQENLTMPKLPLTKDQMPINLLQLSDFHNVHLATNPAHIYLGERRISVISHSYMKQLPKNNLHDMSDRREEFFDTCKQVILANAHLAAGITKTYHSSMNLWHKPDLLVLADTEAFGNAYDYSSSSSNDTSFTTTYSFARQFSQFKVYYLKSGEIEDSQVSTEVMEQIIDDDDDDSEDDKEVEVVPIEEQED